ncbi:MAG: hypothetical protein ABI887_00430 [Burkholderiales bacterium]
MESELGIVLREQQAFLSLLLTRVASVKGEERRTAFETLARALLAHLSEWRSVLLPLAGDTELAEQAATSGRLVAGIVARTRVKQQGVGANNHIQALMTSVLSLMSQERTLLSTTFSALPRPTQLALAVAAEQEFIRLAGTAEFDELRTPIADLAQGTQHRSRGATCGPVKRDRIPREPPVPMLNPAGLGGYLPSQMVN